MTNQSDPCVFCYVDVLLCLNVLQSLILSLLMGPTGKQDRLATITLLLSHRGIQFQAPQASASKSAQTGKFGKCFFKPHAYEVKPTKPQKKYLNQTSLTNTNDHKKCLTSRKDTQVT